MHDIIYSMLVGYCGSPSVPMYIVPCGITIIIIGILKIMTRRKLSLVVRQVEVTDFVTRSHYYSLVELLYIS